MFSGSSYQRKQFIGKLVNLFITTIRVESVPTFRSPLLRLRLGHPAGVAKLLRALKDMTYELVIAQAEVQQLESRGEMIVRRVFKAMRSNPDALIPKAAWNSLSTGDTHARRVCDYVAGMTDPYCERVYRRLFEPGYGSSVDEL